MRVERIPEQVLEGKRLGRHIEHDPRSKDYPFKPKRTLDLRSVVHRRYGGPLDQGDLGSCTGNACAGSINTIPIHTRGRPLLKEADAVGIYSEATKIDEFSGEYPPDDTGSSGLAVAKVAVKENLIGSYQHTFDMDALLQALMTKDVIVGVNWYEGFDNPDEHGHVKIAGQVRGGHEFQIRGLHLYRDLADSYFVAENSWGPGYGLNGIFFFTVPTLEQLLAEDGDATILLPR